VSALDGTRRSLNPLPSVAYRPRRQRWDAPAPRRCVDGEFTACDSPRPSAFLGVAYGKQPTFLYAHAPLREHAVSNIECPGIDRRMLGGREEFVQPTERPRHAGCSDNGAGRSHLTDLTAHMASRGSTHETRICRVPEAFVERSVRGDEPGRLGTGPRGGARGNRGRRIGRSTIRRRARDRDG
jgi:hypothetical protein